MISSTIELMHYRPWPKMQVFSWSHTYQTYLIKFVWSNKKSQICLIKHFFPLILASNTFKFVWSNRFDQTNLTRNLTVWDQLSVFNFFKCFSYFLRPVFCGTNVGYFFRLLGCTQGHNSPTIWRKIKLIKFPNFFTIFHPPVKVPG